jgi:GAF domain-containing protein
MFEFTLYAKKKIYITINIQKENAEMELDILKELFNQIRKVTKVEDIGYHRIVDGKLMPVYKTQTDVLGIEKWKTVHGQNPVHVKGTRILEEVFEKKQPVEIYDTKNDERSADAFFLFGVDSIMIIPIVRSEEVKAIVCIVTIGKLHQFTQDEMIQCTKLVEQYLPDIY